jgi:hypothetical protein
MDSEMTPVDNINVSVLSAEHADILATKWWGAGEFKLRGMYCLVWSGLVWSAHSLFNSASGISCHEGTFMEVETDRIRTAISEYQKVSKCLTPRSASYQLLVGPEFK